MTGPAFLAAFASHMSALHGPRSGWMTPARRAALPHAVVLPGITTGNLGLAGFAAARDEQEGFLTEHCRDDWDVEPYWAGGPGPSSGRRYRFADEADALLFKLRFG